MLQDATHTFPPSIKGRPIILFLSSMDGQEPETKELGQLATRYTIRFCMSCKQRGDLECGNKKLQMRSWELRSQLRGESSGRIFRRAFGIKKVFVPRVVPAKGIAFQSQVAKTPTQDSSYVVGRASRRNFRFESRYKRRNGWSERGYGAFGSQRLNEERNEPPLNVRRSRIPMWVHNAEGFEAL
jgi:hypothetical protein